MLTLIVYSERKMRVKQFRIDGTFTPSELVDLKQELQQILDGMTPAEKAAPTRTVTKARAPRRSGARQSLSKG
jgi:hypothetical protein